MKIKKEFLILGIIICGLLLYIFQRNTDKISYQLPVIPTVAKKEITKIELSKGEPPIVIKKKDDKWYIDPQGFLVDNNKVNDMLDGIEGFSLAALVSESKSYNRYDLDDQNKIQIKAWQGETLKRDFLVGKTASSSLHTFVRLAGDERVYQAQENLRGKFEYTIDNLRDKTVLSFNSSEIQEIKVTKGDKSMTFIRTQQAGENRPSEEADTDSAEPPPANVKTTWQTADGNKVDETRLDRLLSTLSNLDCQRYIDDRKKEELTDPVYAVMLKGKQDYSLSIFAKSGEGNEHYPAVSSGNDYPFELSNWQAEELLKVPDEIVKKPKGEIQSNEKK
jgi:hypothetical protein